MDEGATYNDPYTNDAVLYYDSNSGLYQNKIAGYLLPLNANMFSYNPVTRAISATIYMKYQLQSMGTINFQIEIEDKSGHITTQNVLLSPDLDVPDLVGYKSIGRRIIWTPLLKHPFVRSDYL